MEGGPGEIGGTGGTLKEGPYLSSPGHSLTFYQPVLLTFDINLKEQYTLKKENRLILQLP